jgi:hypothetical protein
VRLVYLSSSVRGFVIGFLVATLFFAFIITDKPTEQPPMDKKKKQVAKKTTLDYLKFGTKLFFSLGLLFFNIMLLLFFFFYVISLN